MVQLLDEFVKEVQEMKNTTTPPVKKIPQENKKAPLVKKKI